MIRETINKFIKYFELLVNFHLTRFTIAQSRSLYPIYKISASKMDLIQYLPNQIMF